MSCPSAAGGAGRLHGPVRPGGFCECIEASVDLASPLIEVHESVLRASRGQHDSIACAHDYWLAAPS
jgi:hypothetical protein